MASASIRFFMKDVDAVKDADTDQCKRTLRVPTDGISVSQICWSSSDLNAWNVDTVTIDSYAYIRACISS